MKNLTNISAIASYYEGGYEYEYIHNRTDMSLS
jgi:hypothetical protein